MPHFRKTKQPFSKLSRFTLQLNIQVQVSLAA